jgi:hypothetical protein
VSARRNAYTLRRRRGEPRSTCSRPTSSGDVSARADESAMLLATFFGKTDPGRISREDCRLQFWSTRGQLLSRSAGCRQPRPPLRGARAWGRRRVLPARTVTLSRRAPSSGVSGPACEPQEESKASPLSETQRLVLKLEGFSLDARRVRRCPR